MKVADEKDLTMGNTDGDAYFKVAASGTDGNEDVRIVNTNGTNAGAIEVTAMLVVLILMLELQVLLLIQLAD